MKKLFVSVPMKGRTEEEIRASIEKMKKIAETYEGEELELIDSYIAGDVPMNYNHAIWCLGRSIQSLAKADIFIGITDTWDWAGCYIEAEVAGRYGIKCYRVDPRYVITNYEALLCAHAVKVGK